MTSLAAQRDYWRTPSFEAEDIIEKYLNEQYRPFAVNDIVQNLHNKITKVNATKALDSLVAQDRITCKMFGKIAIYVCKEQDVQLPAEINKAEITFEAIAQLREEFQEIERDKNEIKIELQNMLKEPSNDELLGLIERKEREISTLQNKTAQLDQNWNPENEKVIKIIMDYETSLEKEIKLRKKIMNNAISLIKEAVNPKNITEFLVC